MLDLLFGLLLGVVFSYISLFLGLFKIQTRMEQIEQRKNTDIGIKQKISGESQETVIKRIFENLALDIFGQKSQKSEEELELEEAAAKLETKTETKTSEAVETKAELDDGAIFLVDSEHPRTVGDEFTLVLRETQENDRDIRSLIKLCTNWVKAQEKFSGSLKTISQEALSLVMKDSCGFTTRAWASAISSVMEHWSHCHSEMTESLHDDVELILSAIATDLSKKEKLFSNERDRLERDIANAKASCASVERETLKERAKMAKLLDRVTDDKAKLGDESRMEYKAAFVRLQDTEIRMDVEKEKVSKSEIAFNLHMPILLRGFAEMEVSRVSRLQKFLDASMNQIGGVLRTDLSCVTQCKKSLMLKWLDASHETDISDLLTPKAANNEEPLPPSDGINQSYAISNYANMVSKAIEVLRGAADAAEASAASQQLKAPLSPKKSVDVPLPSASVGGRFPALSKMLDTRSVSDSKGDMTMIKQVDVAGGESFRLQAAAGGDAAGGKGDNPSIALEEKTATNDQTSGAVLPTTPPKEEAKPITFPMITEYDVSKVVTDAILPLVSQIPQTKPESCSISSKFDMATESIAALAAVQHDKLPVLPPEIASLLVPESAVWLNAFVGRLYRDAMNSDGYRLWFKELISRSLNRGKRPSYVDEFKICAMRFGDAPPVFTNFLWHPLQTTPGSDQEFDVCCSADVMYRGGFGLSIETKLMINKYASMPAAVDLEISELAGRFIFGVRKFRTYISFLREPYVRMTVRPALGNAAHLRDFPRVSDLVASRIKRLIRKKLVQPNVFQFRILWPYSWWPEGFPPELLSWYIAKESVVQPTSQLPPEAKQDDVKQETITGDKDMDDSVSAVSKSFKDSFVTSFKKKLKLDDEDLVGADIDEKKSLSDANAAKPAVDVLDTISEINDDSSLGNRLSSSSYTVQAKVKVLQLKQSVLQFRDNLEKMAAERYEKHKVRNAAGVSEDARTNDGSKAGDHEDTEVEDDDDYQAMHYFSQIILEKSGSVYFNDKNILNAGILFCTDIGWNRLLRLKFSKAKRSLFLENRYDKTYSDLVACYPLHLYSFRQKKPLYVDLTRFDDDRRRSSESDVFCYERNLPINRLHHELSFSSERGSETGGDGRHGSHKRASTYRRLVASASDKLRAKLAKKREEQEKEQAAAFKALRPDIVESGQIARPRNIEDFPELQSLTQTSQKAATIKGWLQLSRSFLSKPIRLWSELREGDLKFYYTLPESQNTRPECTIATRFYHCRPIIGSRKDNESFELIENSRSSNSAVEFDAAAAIEAQEFLTKKSKSKSTDAGLHVVFKAETPEMCRSWVLGIQTASIFEVPQPRSSGISMNDT